MLKDYTKLITLKTIYFNYDCVVLKCVTCNKQTKTMYIKVLFFGEEPTSFSVQLASLWTVFNLTSLNTIVRCNPPNIVYNIELGRSNELEGKQEKRHERRRIS